ncbi:21837_t:CDS:10, partial [Racocetra persica]
IQLNVKGCKTLSDSFIEYIREESCEGNNKYQTKTYGLQDAKKGVIFESFPPVLRIKLKRFEYDMQKNTTVKINDRHEYPMEIDLQSYLSSDSDKSKPHYYLLHGVIVHSGDLHGGRYYVLLKPGKNGKWSKFDDFKVTPVTDKEVLEDNYGNEIAIGTNLNQFKSAYILVYIRESDIDFVLSPVLDKDIPEHLQKKEAKERHLYLTIKIVTLATFERHQGFDLVNFDDRQYSISEVPQFKVLKSETYRTLKTMVSQQVGIPYEQTRLWILVNRPNKTVRLDTPISDHFLDMTMEEICLQHELKLFLEVADKPIDGKEAWFPTLEYSSLLLVFIKYFNPNTQSLEGVCHLYVRKFGNVGDIIPILCEKKNFPPHTLLNIYKEIKPTEIKEMKPELTFQQSEIQDVQEHTTAGRICDIPTFYELLVMCVVVQFKPKHKDYKQEPEFELTLNKNYTYDEIAKRVAIFLKADPLALRFTTAHPTSGTFKTVIKSTTTQTLSEMLQTNHQPNLANLLYYEMLDI